MYIHIYTQLDPARVDPAQIASNLVQLASLAQSVFTAVANNVNAIPMYARTHAYNMHFVLFIIWLISNCHIQLYTRTLRVIWREMDSVVNRTFPVDKKQHYLLRNLTFAKFICAAIASPHAFGVIDST